MNNIVIDFYNGELTLKGILNQSTVESAIAQILPFLYSHKTLQVNLFGVTECDSSSLAFLIMLIREAKKRHTHLTFLHLTKQMHDLAKVCGISDLLFIK